MEIKGMEIKRIGLTGKERIKMNKQEIIKRVEGIEKRLTSLQITMELLAKHTEVIQVVTPDDLHSLNLPTDVLLKCWDKSINGHYLLKSTNDIAFNISEVLSSICYEELYELKSIIKDVMEFDL